MKTLFGRLTELPPAWVCVGKLSHNIFFEVIFRERRVLSNAGGKELRLSNKTKYSFIFAGAVFGGCQNTPNDDNQQKITKKTTAPSQQGQSQRQQQGQPEALNGNAGIVISGHPTEAVRMQRGNGKYVERRYSKYRFELLGTSFYKSSF